MSYQNDPTAIKRYAPFNGALPVPTSTICEAPYVCLRINEQWTPFVLGALETLRWEDLYIGTPTQIRNALGEVGELLSAVGGGNIMCPEDSVQFRQSPTDVCILQTSSDGGSTWQDAFDFSVCMQGATTYITTYQDTYNYNEHNTSIMNIYNNDITNVAPDWEYGDSDDMYRDDALCWALRAWVSYVCVVAINAIQTEEAERQADLRNTATLLETVAEMLDDALPDVVFPDPLSFGALAVRAVSIGFSVAAQMYELPVADFENDAAKDAVACKINSVMTGHKPSFAEWKDALIDHAYTGARANIADWSFVLMQDEASFVHFLDIMEDMIDVSRHAILGCPCENWTYVSDFSINDDDWTKVLFNSGVAPPPYWAGENATHDSAERTWLFIEKSFGSCYLESVTIKYDWSRGSMPDSGWHGITVKANEELVIDKPWNEVIEGSSRTLSAEVDDTVTSLEVYMRCSQNSFGGAIRLRSVTFRGVGYQPPELGG